MKKSLYPGVLFHFTKTKESLFSILRDGFKVSYAEESVSGANGDPKRLGVPMVSFCDLRISELTQHMGKYGYYGIGLKKAWANRSKLHPVLYMNKDHSLFERYGWAVINTYDALGKGSFYGDGHEQIESSIEIFMNVWRYMKNYEGRLLRDGSVDDEFRFADEREWRYVPHLGVSLDYISSEKLDVDGWKAIWNDKIKDQVLVFTPEDIEYVVVSIEDEVEEYIELIKSFQVNYGSHQVDRLLTRILTANQIKRDV